MDFLYKIEIELDDEKIISEHKYNIDDIYATIRKMFSSEGIGEVKVDNHSLVFTSDKNDDKELARFGVVATTLIEKDWFMRYVKKMTWFDTLYGMVSEENMLKVFKEDGLI